jgi:cysteine-rich repeat protein
MNKLVLSLAVACAGFSGCGMAQVDDLHPACATDQECHALGAAFSGHRCDAVLGQCVPDRCGNGEVDLGEACDDANTTDSDACTAGCELAACGDGLLRSDLTIGQVGFEACDDGNSIEGDDCTSTCALPICGDGAIWSGHEGCDDGNRIDNDGCSNDCQSSACGDGIVQDGEECDDEDRLNTNACTNVCRDAVCGDGFVREGVESCDDANAIDDDECTNNCSAPGCGDGVLQDGEACDDGNQRDHDACTTRCQPATCGDGFRRADLELGEAGYEACDDANAAEDDACLSDCTEAACGDGILRTDLNEEASGYEACDDGNAVNSDACLTDCSAEASCGDGILRTDLEPGEEGFEACDAPNNPACSESCMSMPEKLFSGGNFTCAILTTSEVVCWGNNSQGQLGNPTYAESSFVTRPIYVSGLADAVDGAGGDDHACVINEDGQLLCWGDNNHGQLGTGDNDDRATATVVPGLTGVDRVAIGRWTTCAIAGANDNVRCFGNGLSGLLGNSANLNSNVPVNVKVMLPNGRIPVALNSVVSIAVGKSHACASNGVPPHTSTYCWGRNSDNQLGLADRGLTTNRAVLTGFTTAISNLSAGWNHTCGRSYSPRLMLCWGSNEKGQLGRIGEANHTPLGPNFLGTFRSSGVIAIGAEHSLGTVGGAVFAFGDNAERQCGNQFASQVWVPGEFPLGGLASVASGAAGDGHTCVITGDRAVHCWGKNNKGQLGRGHTSASTHLSSMVDGLQGEGQ